MVARRNDAYMEGVSVNMRMHMAIKMKAVKRSEASEIRENLVMLRHSDSGRRTKIMTNVMTSSRLAHALVASSCP